MVPHINFYRPDQHTTQEWLSSLWLRQTVEMPQPSTTNRLILGVSAFTFVASMIATTVLFFPDFFYRLVPFNPQPIVASVDASVLGGSWNEGTLYATITLPPKDENLPEGNWLIIPKIGVRTLIGENPEEKMEESLRDGVWRVPEFGDPLKPREPMILIAHRFGYLKWTNEYRRKNSFYNLDKLEIGDTFDVIWDQRRFTYEIYAGEEGKEITDYEADIILYTCKYLNSPVRFFRYARRVEY